MKGLYAAYARWCCSTQCSPLPGILMVGAAAAGVLTKTGREMIVAAGVKPALIALAVLVAGGLLQIRRSRRLSRIGGGTGPAADTGGSRRPQGAWTPAPKVSGRRAPASQERAPKPPAWPHAGGWSGTRTGGRQGS